MKVVIRMNPDKYRRYFISFIIIGPIISCIGFLAMGTIGYTRGDQFCFVIQRARYSEFYFYFFEIGFVAILGASLFVIVLSKALYWISYSKVGVISNDNIDDAEEADPIEDPTTRGSTTDGRIIVTAVEVPDNGTIGNSSVKSFSSLTTEYAEKIKVLQAPIIFVSLYTLNLFSLVALSIQLTVTADEQQTIFDNWTNCVFFNFYHKFEEQFPDEYDNVDKRNAFAFDMCGSEPANTSNPALVIIVFLSIFFTPTAISFIFCKTEACMDTCCCKDPAKVYNKSSYDSNQSFVTMHVDEMREYNQSSAINDE